MSEDLCEFVKRATILQLTLIWAYADGGLLKSVHNSTNVDWSLQNSTTDGGWSLQSSTNGDWSLQNTTELVRYCPQRRRYKAYRVSYSFGRKRIRSTWITIVNNQLCTPEQTECCGNSKGCCSAKEKSTKIAVTWLVTIFTIVFAVMVGCGFYLYKKKRAQGTTQGMVIAASCPPGHGMTQPYAGSGYYPPPPPPPGPMYPAPAPYPQAYSPNPQGYPGPLPHPPGQTAAAYYTHPPPRVEGQPTDPPQTPLPPPPSPGYPPSSTGYPPPSRNTLPSPGNPGVPLANTV